MEHTATSTALHTILTHTRFFSEKHLQPTKTLWYKKVSADHHNIWKTLKTTWNC